MKYCPSCGTAVDETAKFCFSCGTKLNFDTQETPNNTETPAKSPEIKQDNSGWFDNLTRTISGFAGGSDTVRPPLKTIFGGIFEKHTTRESEEIFICGTSTITPEIGENGKAWPRTWLWTRVLLAFVAAFTLLQLCCSTFRNMNAYPGLMVIGAFMIPIAVLVFFFELNAPRNISFFSVIKYFLVGGCASLVVTLLFFALFSMELNDWLHAILVGVIEETAKLAIVAAIIWKDKNAKYSLNGLLIGAAIGAGFAAFESAGYAFNIFLKALLANGSVNVAYDAMVDNIILRAFLAPGGHVVWAAMAGYAVMLVKGDKALTIRSFHQKAFWKVFWIPIALHAIWDMPISLGSSTIGQIAHLILLVIAAWIVIFVLIGNSLSQIGAIIEEHKKQEPE